MPDPNTVASDRLVPVPFIVDIADNDPRRDFLLSFRQHVIDEPDLVLAGMETYFGMSLGGTWDQELLQQNTNRFIEILSTNPGMLKIINQLRIIIRDNLDINFMNFESREAVFEKNDKIVKLDRTIVANPDTVGFSLQRRRFKLLHCMGLKDIDDITDFPSLP